MHEHELWLTAFFNNNLAGLANSFLSIFNIKAQNPERPWENWIVMEILIVLMLMVLVAAVRSSFSVDKPGKLQHLFEVMFSFLKNTADEVGIHHSERYIGYFGTVFVTILFMNLLGIIPTFESPTMSAYVTCGFAICTFLYFNYMGLREQGAGYLKHFLGPVWWLIPLMIPIEVMGLFAKPLSLTIRLFANMFAGEQVTVQFLKLTYLVIPVIFMALHVFVSFLQAYIFTLLSMIYVSGATAHEEH
jgi:F-type H+-transporting ATPase subunit a